MPFRAEWVLSGGITTTTAQVKVKVDGGSSVRLAVQTDPGFTNPTYVGPVAPVEGIATFDVTGRTANTLYYYAPEIDGVLDTGHRGKFRTAPSGAASFTFCFSSCAAGAGAAGLTTSHSNHMVFDAIRAIDPAFFLHLGDLHYEEIATNVEADWRAAYDRVMANERQAALYEDVPVDYLWDNHDIYYAHPLGVAAGANRAAYRTVRRERFPNYTYPAGAGDAAIYHAFTWGRVRFIVTDTISERSPWGNADNADKSMLGATQKAWFKAELLAATQPVICWVMPAAPWIGGGPEDVANDRWSRFTTERTELADFITTNGLDSKLFVVSADAHMLAYDDGTNAPAGIPVVQAAPLDAGGSTLGGPYSAGTPVGLRGSFGRVTITDTGGASIGVAFSGRRVVQQDSQSTSELVAGSFSISA